MSKILSRNNKTQTKAPRPEDRQSQIKVGQSRFHQIPPKLSIFAIHILAQLILYCLLNLTITDQVEGITVLFGRTLLE